MRLLRSPDTTTTTPGKNPRNSCQRVRPAVMMMTGTGRLGTTLPGLGHRGPTFSTILMQPIWRVSARLRTNKARHRAPVGLKRPNEGSSTGLFAAFRAN